ncbi:MAG TPA: MFS transporter [Acidimicrobiales bacterium]|jgi:MFS family permease
MALLYVITITGLLGNTLLNPALPDVLDDLGVGDGAAGPLVAAGALPGIVMAPVIGLLADRFGRRVVLVPCLVAFGVFGLASALAPSFTVLLVLRLLQGVGAAGLVNLAVVIIGDHWEGIERSRRIGRNAAVLTVGLAVLPPVGGFLTDLGGWRLAFAPYGVGLLTAAVVWRVLAEVRPDAGTSVRAQLGASVSAVGTRRVGSVLVVGFVVFMLIFGLLLTTLPLHLEDRFGLTAGQRGLVLSVPALTSTLGALLVGRLHLRLGGDRVVLVALSLFVVAFAVMAGAPTLPVLVVGALVYGFGEGVLVPRLQDAVAEEAPAASRGAVVAAWVGAARAGQTVGPMVAAGTLATVGTGTTFALGSGLSVALLGYASLVRDRRVSARTSTSSSPVARDATRPSPSTNTKNG